MMKHFLIIALALLPIVTTGQTLDECQQAAEKNYPLIRQYDLIARTTDLTVSNIGKAWLPQVTASAQATLQSDVMSWPDQMQNMLHQMGVDLKGLKKDQYRVGIDVNQIVFDGGRISGQQAVARSQGEVQAAQTQVNLYAVRQRVNEMYFGLLLLDDQIKLNQDLQELLLASENKLASLYKHGTAAESDYNNVKAERLNVSQQLISLTSQRHTLAAMLGTFCGIEVNEVQKPALIDIDPALSGNNRPELRLAETQLRLADAQEKLLDAALLPQVSLFAQGYYGYPGYNMFEDMITHKWSLNGMVGARLNWNIGALYTRHNDKAKLQLQRQSIENNRDVFLYNNRLEQLQHSEEIERYRSLITADDEIIALRQRVRTAAESKLAHGIIDVNDLIKEINNENQARVQRSIHEIELLKSVYDLKYTTNN
jgi:outer membrane protein TolC